MRPSQLITRQSALGLSGKDLAAKLHITEQTLSYWRNGRRPLPADLDARLLAVEAATPHHGKAPVLKRGETLCVWYDLQGIPLSLGEYKSLPAHALYWQLHHTRKICYLWCRTIDPATYSDTCTGQCALVGTIGIHPTHIPDYPIRG